MTIFADWQPRYAAQNIATFPVHIEGDVKRPAIRGYLKLGLNYSGQLPLRFPESTGFGFAVKRSRITVLDVDSSDENILADALNQYGPTPIIVRSGRGNHQAWYRHAGEARRIRPVAGLPIDILGDGYVVAPPSLGARGPYQFLQGRLEDVSRLPPMRALLAPHEAHKGLPPAAGVNPPEGATTRCGAIA